MGFKSQLQNVLTEIAIMKKLEHPNVIQLYEVIDYDEGDKLYMGNLLVNSDLSSNGLCSKGGSTQMEPKDFKILTL